ncbi:MAG: aryl-sulfate sulfotransferase [Actinomycetota bacterium]
MRRAIAIVTAVSITAAACASDDDSDSATEGSDGDAATTDPAVTDPVDDEPVDTEPVATDPVDEPPATEAGTDSEPETGEREVDVEVVASPHISIAAAVEISADEPVRARAIATSPANSVETPMTAAFDDELTVPLVGMRAETTYDIVVEILDESGEVLDSMAGLEFTTGSIPDRVPDHPIDIIDPDRMSPGFTIIEFDTLAIPDGSPSSQYLIAYDAEGEVVWYYENTGALAGIEPTPAGTFNMFYWPFGIREVDLLGNVIGHWRPVGTDDGTADDAEAVIDGVDPDQVQFQGGLGALAGNPGDVEPLPVRAPWVDLAGFHHESWPMPNGNILTLSTTEHELTPEQRATFCPDDPAEFNAISDIAVEFEPDGTVVRTWDLWDAIDIDEFPGREMCVDAGIFAGENNRDWNHANSVTYDPDRDAIIISSRHTNQIVAFDHLDDEGPQTQVRWILGDGATMPFEGEQTYYQHAVEVNPDGTLVVYDNGNFRPGDSPDGVATPPYSRAVIYEVDDSSDDPADWSARQLWEHRDEEADGTPVYASFIGDADVLENGNVLVTHGGIGQFVPPDPDNPLRMMVREVVPSGESGGDVIWELLNDPTIPTVTYRAERIPSFYFGAAWDT